MAQGSGGVGEDPPQGIHPGGVLGKVIQKAMEGLDAPAGSLAGHGKDRADEELVRVEPLGKLFRGMEGSAEPDRAGRDLWVHLRGVEARSRGESDVESPVDPELEVGVKVLDPLHHIEQGPSGEIALTDQQAIQSTVEDPGPGLGLVAEPRGDAEDADHCWAATRSRSNQGMVRQGWLTSKVRVGWARAKPSSTLR